jgi:phospholipase D1/2
LAGAQKVSRITGTLLNQLDQKLSDSGIWAVITFRIFPVAPFSVINLIAGVSKIQLKDFAFGTVIGLLPSLAAFAVAVDWIADDHTELGDFAIALTAVFAAKLVFFSFLMGVRGLYGSKKKAGRG